MNQNFFFLKYWGLLFLDAKHWSYSYNYFWFFEIKVKVINTNNDLLGMPNILLKFLLKQTTFSFFFLHTGLSKNSILRYSDFFNLYSCLTTNLYFQELNKFSFSNYYISRENPLFYVNYNVFSIIFYLKFIFIFKFDCLNIFLKSSSKDLNTFIGIPL